MKKLVIALLCFLLFISSAFAGGASGSSSINGIAIGSTLTFGCYEQDLNFENGPEPIEWIVLEVQDDKALLISKYVLDVKPYENITANKKSVLWETCSLRNWLNSEFIDTAFTKDEQDDILLTEVDNSIKQTFDWTSVGEKLKPRNGKNTQDKLFLLSYAEAEHYFGIKVAFIDDRTNVKPRVAPTAFTSALGNSIRLSNDYLTEEGKTSATWWLRSPGYDKYDASFINYDGSFGCTDAGYHNCIRPVLWIDLE